MARTANVFARVEPELKEQAEVYSGQDSFILMPAATRPRPHS